MKPFFVTVPHSGEKIPAEADWLPNLPEPILMCDVDRYVDRLYVPEATALHVPIIVTERHRYMADLNRLPEDVDASTVKGNANAPGKFSRGFIWAITTKGDRLLPAPIEPETYRSIIQKCFQPFHEQVRAQYEKFKKAGFKNIYHLDAHSMPSMGTSEHRDPGQARPDIVVSDSKGASCDAKFKDLVIEAYEQAGFKVGYNWPYYGGRITETYGHPEAGQHAIQVELNRKLYMDEMTKKILPSHDEVRRKIGRALQFIESRLSIN